jgi:hypothetical protein
MSPFTGGASGSNAGAAAIVGLFAIALDFAVMVLLAIPSLILACQAIKQGPPRILGITALVLTLLTPLWLILGIIFINEHRGAWNLLECWPALVCGLVIVLLLLGPKVLPHFSQKVSLRRSTLLVRGAAATLVAAKLRDFIPHPITFPVLCAAGWGLALVAAARSANQESRWVSGVTAFALTWASTALLFGGASDTTFELLAPLNLAGFVTAIVFMARARGGAWLRRWLAFTVQGVICSVSLLEVYVLLLAGGTKGLLPNLLFGFVFVGSWIANALLASRERNTESRLVRPGTILAAIAMLILPFVVAVIIGI